MARGLEGRKLPVAFRGCGSEARLSFSDENDAILPVVGTHGYVHS